MPDTNLTEDRKRAFAALGSGSIANFCLFSCFVNGEPAAAISAVTPGMRLADHDGREPS